MNNQIYTKVILKLIRTGSQWREARAGDLRLKHCWVWDCLYCYCLFPVLAIWNQDNLVSYFLWNLHWCVCKSQTVHAPVKPVAQAASLLQKNLPLLPYSLHFRWFSLLFVTPTKPTAHMWPECVWTACFDLSSSASRALCTPELLQQSNTLSEHLNSAGWLNDWPW